MYHKFYKMLATGSVTLQGKEYLAGTEIHVSMDSVSSVFVNCLIISYAGSTAYIKQSAMACKSLIKDSICYILDEFGNKETSEYTYQDYINNLASS